MMPCWPGSKEALSHERAEGPWPGGDRGAAARRGMEPEGGRQEAPDVRFAARGLRRVRGVAVREGHARAGAVRQRVRDGGLPEDPPALRRLPDAPELPDQEGGGGSLTARSIRVPQGVYRLIEEIARKHGITKQEAISLLVMRGLRAREVSK